MVTTQAGSPTLPALTISMVTHYPDLQLLDECLRSLQTAVKALHANTGISTDLHIIDNSCNKSLFGKLYETAATSCKHCDHLELSLTPNPRNVGYGRANNQVITKANSKYHIIMNSDLIMDQSALLNAVNYLEEADDVCLLSPFALGADNKQQYLAKGYPDISLFLVRALNKPYLNRRFAKRIKCYEEQKASSKARNAKIEIASGCFMFCRTEALKQCKGFDQQYFLYFEDFDLSLRMASEGRKEYFPAMRIKHYGGHAWSKGMKHRLLFLSSMVKFFNTHGWSGRLH